MKRLLVYLNPQKKFVGESDHLVRIQIDNSLSLGWSTNDILLFTNFPFEYNGVKSQILSGETFYSQHFQATQFVTTHDLFKKGVITNNNLYWALDIDAYQLEPITEEELGLSGFDLGLTTYGWSPRWCLGSHFFKKSAWDIYQNIKGNMEIYSTDDERALRILSRENKNNFMSRIKTLNITYNFGMRNVSINWQNAQKPLKVVHFHPWYKGRINTLDIFMYGKSDLGFPLMNSRLIKIFKDHGIK